MSEFKGTPGPWKTQFKKHAQLQDGSHVHVLTDAENFNIGLLSSWVNDLDTRAEAEANAKLIAAAPELLAALDEILNLFTPAEQIGNRILIHARAAIAKATA